MTVGDLNNTGSINLTGNQNPGTTQQAVVNILAAAPTTWTGKVFLSGQSLLDYGSGQITTIAQGAEIDIATPVGYVADAGATGSNSALTGLTSVAGDFELQYGAVAALSSDLSVTGSLELDTANNYADTATGGSLLTIAGTLNNTGFVTIGSSFLGTAQLSSNSTLMAAGLANTGTITLTGGSAAGTSEQAVLDIAAAAPAVWTGTLSMGGQAILEYGSGSITSVALGAQISLVDSGMVSVASGANLSVSGASTESGKFTLAGSLDLAAGLEVTGTGSLVLQGGMAFTPNGAGLTVDAGGTVSGNGSLALAVANSGTITASGGALDITGAVSGGGALAITGTSSLEIGGATAETVAFGGAGETLKLDQPGAFTGAITGLVAGDTIDLGGAIATNAVINGTTLTVTTAAGSTMSFQVAGTDLATTPIVLANDFHGGTDLELVPPGPVISGPTTQLAFLGFPSVLGPLSISDREAGATGMLAVTLTAQTGTLFGTAANAGTVTGSATNSLTLSGNLNDVNEMLAAVIYAGTANGSDTVQISVSDTVGAMTAATIGVTTQTVPFTPEVINAPDTETVIIGTATAYSGISVSDPYAETTGQTATLGFGVVDGETLHFGGSGGVVTGEGTPYVSLSGTVAAINGYSADIIDASYTYASGELLPLAGVSDLAAEVKIIDAEYEAGLAAARNLPAIQQPAAILKANNALTAAFAKVPFGPAILKG